MARKSTGSRFQLGEPLASDLTDFSEAHYSAPEVEIIRRAVRAFIDAELENDPAGRRRFDEARRTRLAAERPAVALVKPKSAS